jgi:hypothetical protein
MPSLKKSKVEPRTERPRIPGYGISKSKTGMLPWEWAVKTLADSREYWIVTVRSDGHGPAVRDLQFLRVRLRGRAALPSP